MITYTYIISLCAITNDLCKRIHSMNRLYIRYQEFVENRLLKKCIKLIKLNFLPRYTILIKYQGRKKVAKNSVK